MYWMVRKVVLDPFQSQKHNTPCTRQSRLSQEIPSKVFLFFLPLNGTERRRKKQFRQYGLGTALQMFTRSYNDSQGTFLEVEVYLHLTYMNFTGLQVIHKEFTLILVLKKLCSVPFFAGVLFFNSSLQNSHKGHAASLAVRESG